MIKFSGSRFALDQVGSCAAREGRRNLGAPKHVERQTVEIPQRAWLMRARLEATLSAPSGARGWVVMPATLPGSAGEIPGLAAALWRRGVGTLELQPPGKAICFEARCERLVEALHWLGRLPLAKREAAFGLVGWGLDAAPALRAAGWHDGPLAGVVAAGQYRFLDRTTFAGVRAPVRLIVTRDEEEEAKRLLAIFAKGFRSGVSVVQGTAGAWTLFGRWQARWYATAWLADHVWAPPEFHATQARWRRRFALAGLATAAAHFVVPVLAAPEPRAALPATIELSALNGSNGFRINGIAAGDLSGWAVSGAGDVNGDGFADLLIGAIGASPNSSYSGQSYVVYGGAHLPSTIELSSLDGAHGCRINGIAFSDKSGYSVSGAGDVNGDGFADLLIGAPLGGYSGEAYVVYGGSALPGTIELSALDGTDGFRLNGVVPGDSAGRGVSGAGDVNNDGFADLLVGAPFASPNGPFSGQIYVVYGGPILPGTIELAALDSGDGFYLNGIALDDKAGNEIAGAGDINGDGFADLLIGIRGGHVNGLSPGQSYVVYGGPTLPGIIELSALNGTNGFLVNGIATGDASGASVSGAGDINGDDFADLLIGSPGADPNGIESGRTFVVYGGASLPATIELYDLDDSNGLRANGIAIGDFSGFPVSGAGDVNGDGFADFLIGASSADPNGNSSGQSYLIYGGSGLPGTIELSGLDGTDGLRINGISAHDYSGGAVSSAGDVNGDGFADLVIGARYAGPNGLYSGQSYVVYGGVLGISPPEIPSLRGWGLLALSTLLAFLGLARLSR